LVFLGGGLGAAARHGVNRAAAAAWGFNFPCGTLIVNVAGSLVMGLMAGWFALRTDVDPGMRLFLTTGFLGGFTTFSAFSLDAAVMWQRGDYLVVTAYILASVLLSIGGLLAGMASIRMLA